MIVKGDTSSVPRQAPRVVTQGTEQGTEAGGDEVWVQRPQGKEQGGDWRHSVTYKEKPEVE